MRFNLLLVVETARTGYTSIVLGRTDVEVYSDEEFAKRCHRHGGLVCRLYGRGLWRRRWRWDNGLAPATTASTPTTAAATTSTSTSANIGDD